MPADLGRVTDLRLRAKLAARILWICLYSFVLLLALRWCARTYPGWYFPNSPFLNDLLNGVGLFTIYGYDTVLIAAAAAVARVFVSRGSRPGAAAALRLAQWTSLAIVALLICYGIWWADWTGRLPWQEDGVWRFQDALRLV